MKIIIIGKRDQMGTTPVIRVKGMSRLQYNFEWDKTIRHYAYTPKEQREVDDIFRTQGRLYKRMFFSVWLEEKKEPKKEPKKVLNVEEEDHHFVKDKASTKKTKAKDLQAVEKKT